MCGITGIVNFKDFVYAQEIEQMTNSLAHRGPDGDGVWIKDNVAIGHRRLSIIDLENGRQPLSNEDGTVWITFNGEIYNYKELRDYLIKVGHKFKTQSDTEVIVHAYEEWGKSCVKKFRGMFAFGIVDLNHLLIFLARDQLGIKPLYYISNKHTFAFSSEIQTLLKLPQIKQSIEPDLEGIYEFLRFSYIPAPRTGYKDIYKLPPGHYIEMSLDGKSNSQPERYWELNFEPDLSKTEDEWQEIIEDALKESVRAHLVSDVPFGAFLSGGLDSTLVVDYMQELLQKPVLTFNIGFIENDHDERPYARLAASTLGTSHFEEVVTSDALELLPKLVRHYGEPFGDCSAIPTWHVSNLARQHVPMVLSGDGGDEFFGGYHSYRCWLEQLYPRRAHRPVWKQVLRPFLSQVLPQRYPPDPKAEQPTLESWLNVHNFISQQEIQQLLQNENAGSIANPDSMAYAFSIPRNNKPLACARSVDIHNYLPFDILFKVDIASMMNSLECRTPFTDVRIAELAATIPTDILIKDEGLVRGWEGKQPFRQILRRKFSTNFVDRSKQGFGLPLKNWLFHDPKYKNAVRERLMTSNARINKWLNEGIVHELYHSQLEFKVWHLMVLEEWMEQNNF